MSMTERCFTLSHTFSDVSEMKSTERKSGGYETHHGIKWKIYIQRWDKHASIYLYCSGTQARKWTISTHFKIEINSLKGKPFHKQENYDFAKYDFDCGFREFIDWSELSKNYLKDNKLQVKCHVTIKSMIEINTRPVRRFDKSMEKFSDVILKVGGQDFYVSKLTLAMQSPYFEGLFRSFQKSNKSTIELHGVNPEDFQDYLDLLFTKSVVSDCNLERMLEFVDVYETPMVLEKCKDQLMNWKSFLSKKEKFRLTSKFLLKDVTDFLIEQCETIEELDSIPNGTSFNMARLMRARLRLEKKQSSKY